MVKRSGSKAAVRLLRSLEAHLVAMDEGLLLTTVCLKSSDTPRTEPKPAYLRFRAVESPCPERRRVRFAPVPDELDRLVIQNWSSETGFVPIGDMELELDPGQAVTLWIGRSAATPVPAADERAETPGSLLILPDPSQLVA
jgi:hypothetical protein